MIQRIQSLYLLAASIFMGTPAIMRLLYLSGSNGFYELYARGIFSATGEKVESTIYMLALLVIGAVLPITTIFQFNNRKLQVKLCIMSITLAACSLVLIGAYCHLMAQAMGITSLPVPTPVAALPILAIVVEYMAIRAIKRDEDLIRSLDRIR
ncbi:MAG: DUF4293 domain-containing protein [Rikenellaceae bacterium]